jgi:hypothetical protein
MIGLTLLTMTLAAIACLSVLCVAATRDSVLIPATVNPFAGGLPSVSDATAETMPLSCHSANTLTGDWQTTEVVNLFEVEEVLDWAENSGFHQTDLTNHDGKFQVRWR